MPGSAIDPRDLRVSDAERAHVMSLLEKATGRGLISLVEFEERSAAVIVAKTRADLNVVLLDLPGLVYGDALSGDPGSIEFGVPGGRSGPASTPVRPSSSPSVLELLGRGSTDLRGHWVVPTRIVIGGAGPIRLDFCDAQLAGRTVGVEFVGRRHGSVEMIVPVGTRVRLDHLVMRAGGIDNQVAPGAGTGALELVLVGEKRGGWLRIRHPRRGLFGRG